mmetsp:Transcript_25861/g.31881  ORF Transcript_25861/g.31881 Transcript_25861/m.31881 type:complete len:146 (+) Transcript_25861:268-705(+)
MTRNYLQVKQFLEQEFPELRDNITGGNYAPPKFAVYMMKVISVFHMITIAFCFLGDNLWTYIPGISAPPDWYINAKKYPLQSLITIFLIIPSFAQSFITTGAFEIACNDEVLFSKLALNRFPNGNDLIEAFKNFGLAHAGAGANS